MKGSVFMGVIYMLIWIVFVTFLGFMCCTSPRGGSEFWFDWRDGTKMVFVIVLLGGAIVGWLLGYKHKEMGE